MRDFIKTLLLTILVLYFGVHSLFPQEEMPLKEPTKLDGLDVAYVINVSSSMSHYQKIIERFVRLSCDAFGQEGKNNRFYLVTFSDRAQKTNLKVVGTSPQDIIVDKVKTELAKRLPNAFSKIALAEVFDLVETEFPRFGGVVVFVSDGNDNSPGTRILTKQSTISIKSEMCRTIRALKKNGFTLYSIRVSTKMVDPKQKYFMEMISEWAKTNPYVLTRTQDVPVVVGDLLDEVINTPFYIPVNRFDYLQEYHKWKKKQEAIDIQQLDISTSDEAVKDIEISIPITNIWVVLQSIFIVLFASGFGVVFFKMKKLQQNKNHTPPQKLWGKLKRLNGGEENPYIDLKDIKEGESIICVDPKISFRISKCRYNLKQKVLCVQPLKGSVQFLKQEKPGKFIVDEQSHFLYDKKGIFKVTSQDKQESALYEFHFLDALEESCLSPVSQHQPFFGYKTILQEIEANFLERDDSKRRNIIISGIGNSGKSSLLKYLHNTYFKRKKSPLHKNCITQLIEYKDNFEEFKADFIKSIARLQSAPQYKHKILMIDEYDHLFPEHGSAFNQLLGTNHLPGNLIYFILAGRTPGQLIEEPYDSFIPALKFDYKVLNGIKDSEDLIAHIIEEAGFSKERFTEEIKNEIVRFSSGLPYFTKKIIIQLLKQWLKEEWTKTHWTVKDVETAALTVAKQEGSLYKNKIVPRFDEKDRNRADRILFEDILEFIEEKGNGKVKLEELKTIATEKGGKRKQELGKEKKICLQMKLMALEHLGLIETDGEWILGVPLLQYYHQNGDLEYEKQND